MDKFLSSLHSNKSKLNPVKTCLEKSLRKGKQNPIQPQKQNKTTLKTNQNQGNGGLRVWFSNLVADCT